MSKLYLQEKLVGEPGQVVGFDANGKAVAEDSKGAALKAETASIVGLDPEVKHTADDGIFALAIGVGKYAFRLTVTAADGTPIPGVVVSGNVTNIAGGSNVVTDDGGYAMAITTTPEVAVTLLSPYIDMVNKALTLTATGKVNSIQVQMETRNYVEFTKSATVKFSPSCTRLDVACGAGGQSGKYFTSTGFAYGGDGGNGGNTAIAEDVSFMPMVDYQVTVGAGGAAGQNGQAGGASSALGVVASGQNNGIGGVAHTWGPSSATNGTQQIFSGFNTLKLYGGGGGAGNAASDQATGVGAAPGGGTGGIGNGSSPTAGVNGLGGGGGGVAQTSKNSGAGGSGLVCFRMWHGEEDVA